MIKNLSAIIFLFLFVEINIAQTFEATVDKTTVGSDERFEVKFTYSGSDVNGLSDFQPPKFENFVVLSGPNQSTSMQWINGVMSGSRTYSYIVQARSMGKFTIQSASIKAGGETLKTNPITIEVVKGTTQPKRDSGGDSDIDMKEIAENCFILALVDKSTVFIGEQVTVTYKLYTRLNIASPQVSKIPNYQGFWAEEIDLGQNIQLVRENYNGKQYNTAVLKKAALFPSQTGELTVTPFELTIPIQIQKKRKSTGFFDDFFNDPFFNPVQTIEFKAKSNSVKVKVNPLPSTNLSSFKGAVGNFNITSEIDKQETKQNEPITLKIKINGSGNIKLLEISEPKFPTGFEKFDPKTSETINRSGVVNGTKTFEYLLVPRMEGKYEIPPIEFTYFNPAKKEYSTLSTKPYPITVKKGDGVQYTSIDAGNKVDWLDRDIRYIKTNVNELKSVNVPLYNSPVFYFMIGLPLTAFILFIFWRRKEITLSENVSLAKRLYAEKVAKKRLKQAEKLLKAGKQSLHDLEIARAVNGYFTDKLNIGTAELSVDSVIEKLKERNISDELIKLFSEVMQQSDFIRYAPSAASIEGSQHLYQKAKELIVKSEESL